MTTPTKFRVSLKPLIMADATGRDTLELIRETKQTAFPTSDWLSKIIAKKKEEIIFSPGHTLSFGFIRGNEYEDDERMSAKIDEDAMRDGGRRPLVGDIFSFVGKIKPEKLKEQGLRTLVLMHEPITDLRFTEEKFRIGLCLENDKGKLEACYGQIGGGWLRDTGFVYLMP
jgi:hypothetical protein